MKSTSISQHAIQKNYTTNNGLNQTTNQQTATHDDDLGLISLIWNVDTKSLSNIQKGIAMMAF